MLNRFRQSTLVLALGAAALITAAGIAHAQPAPAAATPPAAAATAPWLTLGQIYDTLIAAGYTDVREIERERSGYEAKARDREGRWVELHLEPISGNIIDQRVRRDRDD